MESAKEVCDESIRGPFTATKLWNSLVSQFKSKVQVKRRRWRMKVYLDAFTGTEAVDRLHDCLRDNPHFGPSVNRLQAQQLCKKFLENGVIEDVRGKEFNSELEDNGHLYRFVSMRHSPYKVTRSRRRNLTLTVGKEISAIMSTFFSKESLHVNALTDGQLPSLGDHEVQENPCLKTKANRDCLLSEKLEINQNDKNSTILKTHLHTEGQSLSKNEQKSNTASCSKNNEPVKQRRSLRKKQITCRENSLAELEKTNSIKAVKATPMKRGLSRLITAPFTPASYRTPLVNKLNVLRSVKSESKLESRQKNPQTNGTVVPGQVIMNTCTLTLEEQNACRNLSEQEIEHTWQSIVILSLKRLLEIEESENLTVTCGWNASWVLQNFQEQRICKAHEVLPQWVVNAMKCLLNWSEERAPDMLDHLPCYRGFERDVFKAIVEFFDDLQEPLVNPKVVPLFLKTAAFIPCFKATAMRALQHCCLILDPCNRRILQVLLKFMIRLTQNREVVLSDDLPTRELVIQSFSKCTFNMTGDVDVVRVLFFMMESFPACFKNPGGLQYQVEQRVICLKNCKENEFKCIKPPPRPVAYCKQVTSQEYEEQRRIMSQRALMDLLNQIVEDQTIDEKDRTKRLHKFQKSYPELYSAKFCGENQSRCFETSVSFTHKKKPLTTVLINL